MPKALERKLKREAKKKGVKDEDAYVYGTLRKTGWVPSTQRKGKTPKRKKKGRGHWPNELQSAGGSKTVLSRSDMLGG